MSSNSDKQLLEIAQAVSDRRNSKWMDDFSQLGEEDQETAAVLAALARLFRADDQEAHVLGATRSWGPFDILGRVGNGSFGEVYRARDQRLEREVALKFLRAGANAPKDADVFREGKLLARVKSENIAKVFGVEKYGGQVGIVMEFIEGEDLASLVAARGPLSAREAALIGVDLCQALAALHHARVLHRDVKAENVLREAGGRTVLVDLGIGAELGELAPTRGTPLYLAPEFFLGVQPTPQSDLYALGVLLFYLISGRFPVEAETFEELRQAHRAGHRLTLRDARPDVPWSFAQVVGECLRPDPRDRLASAGKLERHLRAILDPGGYSEGRQWPRRQRLAAGMIAAVIAMVLLWLALSRLDEGRRAPQSRIVIGEIVNRTTERLFDHAPQNVLQLGLENARDLSVLPRERVHEVLRRMNRNPETQLVGKVGRELCLREDYELFVEGTLEISSASYELRLQGSDCQSGELRFQRQRSFISKNELTEAMDDLVRDLRHELGELEFSDSTPLAEATTSSLEALAHFSEAVVHQQSGDLVMARELLEVAIEEDSNFALAYAQLATCRNGLGDLAGALEAAEAAFERRDRATERERYRITLMYHLDRLQYEDALPAARRLAALYPHDAEARRQLAHLHARMGRLADAVEAMREATKLSSGVLPLGVLAGYLNQQGDHDEALAICHRARTTHGAEPSFLDWAEGLIHLDRSKYSRARSHFERLESAGSIYSEASTHLLALTEVFEGRTDAAHQRLLGNAASHAESRYWTIRDRRLAARLAIEAGARSALDRELAFFHQLPELPIHLRDFRAVALLWALAGSVEQTQEMSRRLVTIEKRYPSRISRAARLQIEAELARLSGDLENARDKLAAARRVWWGDIAILLSELRLAEAAGDSEETSRLRRLLVEEKKGEMIELGYGFEWLLLSGK